MKKVFWLLTLLFLLPRCFGEALVDEALLHLEKPYIYTSAGAESFDCSGFTFYCVKEIYGIELPRSAYGQGYDDTYPKIEQIEDLKPGDLVFFDTIKDKDLCDHAGIYIGNNQFIHASSSQEKVVISDITDSYYLNHFSWGRRIAKGVYYEKPYHTRSEKQQLETCAP